MGLAVFAASYLKNRKNLGWIVVAGCRAAFVDGAAVKAHVGFGEWNHWGYVSMFTVAGSVLVGLLDGF
jgi:hypothetical protein